MEFRSKALISKPTTGIDVRLMMGCIGNMSAGHNGPAVRLAPVGYKKPLQVNNLVDRLLCCDHWSQSISLAPEKDGGDVLSCKVNSGAYVMILGLV